jgi:integrase
MMLEELQRRNYSESTIRYYIRAVEDFSRRFNRPPDRLGLRHIREYQAELFQKQKLSSGTVNNRLAALRFFYIKTLKKAWSIAETPYPKRAFHLPSILSQEEVTQLIDVGDGMQAKGTMRNTGSPSGDRGVDQLATRERQAGPYGMAERLVVPMKPGNSGGGKEPQLKGNARSNEGPRDWR